MSPNQTEKLKAMIVEADKRSLQGRLDRLQFLLKELSEDYVPFPAIVLEYFEETKLCFYQGAFVASVLMAQATFEELFRQIYRDADQMSKAESTFANLIKHSVADGLISLDEEEELTTLRKVRNKFTHIKIDFRKGRTLLDFTRLWCDPYKEHLQIETLAQNAIHVFSKLVPKLCHRYWGLCKQGEAC